MNACKLVSRLFSPPPIEARRLCIVVLRGRQGGSFLLETHYNAQRLLCFALLCNVVRPTLKALFLRY